MAADFQTDFRTVFRIRFLMKSWVYSIKRNLCNQKLNLILNSLNQGENLILYSTEKYSKVKYIVQYSKEQNRTVQYSQHTVLSCQYST